MFLWLGGAEGFCGLVEGVRNGCCFTDQVFLNE